MKSKIGLVWTVFPTTWASLLLTLLLFPAGYFLPDWCSWENQPLENIQAVMLLVGAFLAFKVAQHNTNDKKLHALWLWTIPLWLFLLGRELSWGRVFLTPVMVNSHGPVFPALRQVWFGRYVYPLNTVAGLTTFYGIWKNWEFAKLKRLRYPLIDIGIFIFAVISNYLFEREMITSLVQYSQVLEEWSEIIAYWCLISILVVMGFNKLTTKKKFCEVTNKPL